MKRRTYLGVTSTLLFAGCLSSSDEPGSGPTETVTPSASTRTPQEQTSSPETETPQTPTPPYTFVSVGNRHDTSHRIRVTITSVATGETLAEEERQIERENHFKISDEWLTEAGRYEVSARTDDGRSTSIEVEADESWACNHTVHVDITSDGQLISGLSAGMRKGC